MLISLEPPAADAACHNAGAAIDAPYGTNLNIVSGVDEFGIHCDYCHKVVDVTLDPNTGLPYRTCPACYRRIYAVLHR